MEIHKPKPWHGVREFLKEYLIIVVGVLTALAAEQTVEWLHWQAEIREARGAIREEMRVALEELTYRQDENSCVKQRIDQLEAWSDSYDSGKPIQPKGRIGRPIEFNPPSQTWETLRTTPGVTHMPTDERLQIAGFYAFIELIRTFDGLERGVWMQLQEFNEFPTLDASSRMRLRGAIENARETDGSIHFLTTENIPSYAKSAGVPDIGERHFDGRSMPPVKVLCNPLF